MRPEGDGGGSRDVGLPAMKPVSRARAWRNEATGAEAALASGVGSSTSCRSDVSLCSGSRFYSALQNILGPWASWSGGVRTRAVTVLGGEVALPGTCESGGREDGVGGARARRAPGEGSAVAACGVF